MKAAETSQEKEEFETRLVTLVMLADEAQEGINRAETTLERRFYKSWTVC
jgi:hypothetical protein